ncbi:hypothetical protein ALP03_200132 [Pseudomonas amygdali pv. tabaci]|uniref:Uncharacterized protein n=1 Tax=Pseudomonas amygdali pv. tabaci TaxID=322 RepID=A0A3M6FR15_PSEAJ|nr:hypothetical protein ALP03_200132 [Pseudomonas amygdali pv. tabaci]
MGQICIVLDDFDRPQHLRILRGLRDHDILVVIGIVGQQFALLDLVIHMPAEIEQVFQIAQRIAVDPSDPLHAVVLVDQAQRVLDHTAHSTVQVGAVREIVR